MINKGLGILTMAGAAMMLVGCSYIEKNPVYGEHGMIRDRSQDYMQAAGGDRLQIPEHIKARETYEQLQVPDVGVTATRTDGRFEVPRPEFFYADPVSDSVSLARLDGERIIVVDEPIADVWVKILDFWEYNGIDVARTDPRLGIMETDWIRTDAQEYGFVDRWFKRLTLQGLEGPVDNKLRVSIRPDPDDYDRTSIRMSHVAFAASERQEEVNWDQQQMDVSYQSDMMFEMLRYLSRASAPTTAQSLLALQQQQQARPLLGRDSRGNPALRINAPVDEVWDLLDTAIESTALDVGTRDKEGGVFYMSYTTSTPIAETRRRGFMEWLTSEREEIKLSTSFLSNALGFSEEEQAEAIAYSSGDSRLSGRSEEDVAADLSDPNNLANQDGYKIWLGGRVIFVFGGSQRGVYNTESGSFEHTGRYQLKLHRIRTGVIISVLTDQGLDAPAVVAEEILWQIKDQLPSNTAG